MRKLVLALTITLALSLALGGGLALAAKAVTPGVPLLAKYGLLAQLDENTNINENANGNTNDDANDNANDNDNLNDNANDNSNVNTNDNTNDAANDGAYCRGDKTKKHPTGEKLAGEFFGTNDPAAFEAGYTEIMGWFCGGTGGSGRYGFGEIRLGYQIAAAAGLTPAEIFAMRADGKGWGNILKDLGLKMKDVKPPNPNKPTTPGNGNGNNGNAGGNAYGQDKEKSNNGQGNAYGHDKDKGNKGKKP
jgi:hypothetical protein